MAPWNGPNKGRHGLVEDVDGSMQPTGELSTKSVGWQPSGAEVCIQEIQDPCLSVVSVLTMRFKLCTYMYTVALSCVAATVLIPVCQ